MKLLRPRPRPRQRKRSSGASKPRLERQQHRYLPRSCVALTAQSPPGNLVLSDRPKGWCSTTLVSSLRTVKGLRIPPSRRTRKVLHSPLKQTNMTLSRSMLFSYYLLRTTLLVKKVQRSKKRLQLEVKQTLQKNTKMHSYRKQYTSTLDF